MLTSKLLSLAGASALIVALACGSDTNTTAPSLGTAAQSSGGGATGNDTGNTTPSNGPVASVQVGPKTASMQVGSYMLFTAVGLDLKGAHVAGTKATWRSSNSDVVVTSDTGIVYAKATGTAKVYGTIDGHIDSATVTVTPRSDSTVVTHPDTGVAPPPAPVSSFDLTATILGRLAGTDTSRTEAVAGATIRLTRVTGVKGDTLNPSVTAGSAVSDANGVVTFKGLTGGAYVLDIVPAAGSAYAESTSGFGPPTATTQQVRVVLQRN